MVFFFVIIQANSSSSNVSLMKIYMYFFQGVRLFMTYHVVMLCGEGPFSSSSSSKQSFLTCIFFRDLGHLREMTYHVGRDLSTVICTHQNGHFC